MNDQFGGNKGYISDANANMFVIAQLESQASIDNLDAIVSVPGIHCITFGQNDWRRHSVFPESPAMKRSKTPMPILRNEREWQVNTCSLTVSAMFERLWHFSTTCAGI
jgi:hypothetical protein